MSVKQSNVDAALREPNVREEILTPDGPVPVLWLSRVPAKTRPSVLAVYGPTQEDVERNLGVKVYYEGRMPEIYPTQSYLERVPEVLDELKEILATEGQSLNKYHRVYHALFRYDRVTYTQMSEVLHHIRAAYGVKVPHQASWYFRFNGYLEFMKLHIQWLEGLAKGRDLPEGEDVLLVEPPIDVSDLTGEY